MQQSPAGRADPDNKCVVLCPLHVTLACVHVRAVPSTFDKYLRASRIAVPAVAFVSPPPLPFVANTASADTARTCTQVSERIVVRIRARCGAVRGTAACIFWMS